MEYLAWKLKIDEALLPHIQRLKTTQIPHHLGFSIRVASGLSDLAKSASPQDRLDFLRFLAQPTPAREKRIRQVLKESIGLRENQIEALLAPAKDRSALEKLPILELLLGCRSKPYPQSLAENERTVFEMIEELLGWSPSSTKARFLKAYLQSIPAHEIPSTLAYLLSHSNQKEEGIKPIFELFTTVGVKTGQLAGILNLFEDPTIQSQLADLKDHAQPMEKAEIFETLRNQLPPEEFQKIQEIPRILGSASIKTVIEVKLKDGSTQVALIRRPHAKNLLEANLQKAHRFLNELKKDPEFASKARSIETVLQIIQLQLEDETDFHLENEKLRRAGQIFGTSRQPISVALSRPEDKSASSTEWTLQVPQSLPPGPMGKTDCSEPQILFLEKADGIPFSALPDRQEQASAEPSPRRQAGKVIVQQALSGLFHQGFFNADPHQGNFLVDPAKRIIYPIDFGQAEQLDCEASVFKEDELGILAQFLWACQSAAQTQDVRDVRKVLDFGKKMASTSPSDRAHSPRADQKLEAQLRQIAKDWGSDPAQFMVRIIQALSDANRPLDKKYFAVLKGLAVLSEEQFVPKSEFNTLLGEQIRAILSQRKLQVAADGFCRLFRQAVIDPVTQRLNPLLEGTPTHPQCQEK